MIYALQGQRLLSSGGPFAGGTQCLGNLGLGFAESDSVLRAFRSSDTGHHVGKVQSDGVVVLRRRRIGCSKKPLTPTVRLD